MTGRARGRGVARGRGAPPQQNPGSANPNAGRRPGSAPVPAPAQPATGGGGDNGNGNGAGRAAQRGGARGEPRPGPRAPDPLVDQMQQLEMGTGDAGDQRRGRREINYQEPNTRPAHIVDKRGASGVPIPLMTNYFDVDAGANWHMYQYHVEFNPAIASKKLRKGLLHEHAKGLFKQYLFDGQQLYTSTKLSETKTDVMSVRNYDQVKINITIMRTAELPPTSPMCIQIFNVMMRQILTDMGMKEVQRAYYSPDGAIKLPRHHLEIWPGYKTSILQYEERILLNLDISHKVLRTDSVLQSLYQIYEAVNRNFDEFKVRAMKELVGEIVLTRYNNKTYRIDDIDWDIHPTMTFKKRDEDVTYKQYYREAYNVEVRDDLQPMLVSRPKKKDQREGAPQMLYLLPELCTRTGLTDQMRNNFNLMKDMGEHTRINPDTRAASMNTFRAQIENNSTVQERLAGWQMKYSRNLVTLEGRTLGAEKILLGPDGQTKQAKVISGGRDADWGRDATRGKQFTTVPIDHWVVIHWKNNENAMRVLFDNLQKVGNPMGVLFRNAPRTVSVPNQSTSSFLTAIKTSVEPTLQLIIVILPSNKKDLYDAVKKQCCLETPVPSQCITANLLLKPKVMSPISKIVVQINCKLGGEAWAVEIPLKNTMVIGIDTYHDSSKKGRSVGGFVASLNATYTRYYSQTIFQSNTQELIDGLKVKMTAALRKYHSINDHLPDRIFVYRDGVGDGQLPVVHDHELPQIIEGAKELGTNYQPKISMIVVKKRINSRFFAKAGKGLANPPPGTIVDSVVTRRESYDFFLVAQSVRMGTVTPTHYNCIHDDNQLKPDHVQKLSYKLCHLYYNWPGTIRVPAPCMYAHKLAFLTGQSLHRLPDLSLADKLYYL